jgi:hypothetical protein
MELVVKKTETGATPRILRRDLERIAREAGQYVGQYWHRKFRPLHFRNLATTRYGYQLRQGERGSGYERGFRRSYTGQKLRKFGHTKPLVYTGDSERRTEIENIRSTYRAGMVRIHVIMNAPTLNFRRWPHSPDMRQELTTVIPEELAEMSEAASGFLRQRIELIRQTQVVMLGAEVLV